MASLELRGGRYRLAFRWGGRKHQHPLRTADLREAESCRERLEEGLRLLERGRLEPPPPGADLGLYLLSDGKVAGRPAVPARSMTLGELFDVYRATLTDGAKAATTLATERTHTGHLRAGLGPKSPVEAITKAQLQAYADRRTRSVGPATVRKELATLGYIWRWALDRGHVRSAVPALGVTYRKQAEKEPFRTWSEIEAIVASGGCTTAREGALWESLFLDEEQVREVLAHAARAAADDFAHPMIAFAAYTGAEERDRRERAGRLRPRARVVLIREKKRRHSVGGSYRHVPLHSSLAEIVSEWFARSPGRRHAFSRAAGAPLTWNVAQKALRRALDGSRWEKITGWHTFRHSFASNCASRGVPQSHIDAWLGHQTAAMRERYRHLFPHDLRESIERLFPAG